MKKQLINCEFVEVAEGDEVIRVALMTTYWGAELICEVKDDFHILQSNVRANVEKKFMELSDSERRVTMEQNETSSLVTTHIKDMLKSEYEKECNYTPASILFCSPKG